MPKKLIMIVEDNSLNRELLSEILKDQYRVLEAENGQVALDLLKQYKSKVDLILLDIIMPVMDGFTFLDRVSVDEELSRIPVIVMTQSDGKKDEVEALSHGATDFVPKPYRPQIILQRVANIIKLRETAAMVNLFQYDRLTGLYTKEFFCQKAQDCLLENPDKEYNLVCSNIENFKLYNDIFGIQAGDRLLKQSADRLREMVGENGLYGRFGADRFIMMLERDKEEIDRDFLIMKMKNDRTTSMNNVVVKWGVYEIADHLESVEKMCDWAFIAADSIKGQYNQYIAVYDDTLRRKLLREQSITNVMENALQEEQFTVYFQPKYSLHDDGLAGAEALVRWEHPEWGVISPGEFIPLFEKNGFITRLDQYVWEKVCSILHEWKEKGYPTFPVSVNVSRADVYQSDLAESLLKLTQKYDIHPSLLHLELTESAYTENPDQILSTVERLRNKGFIVEMDDFGSGYSSLNMLNQMKLDVLKLDMKFIQNETAKPEQQGVLRFVVSLARWLNMSVVAEGVETRAQLERLREIGCDYVQGYLLAKPMPRDSFEELIRVQRLEDKTKLEEVRKNEHTTGILIVDEDADYRERIRRIYEENYQIWEASDVETALACSRVYGQEKILAVVLSMSLPNKGAEVFLKEVRRDPRTWRIPVLAILQPCDLTQDMMVTELDTDDFICRHHPMRDVKKRLNRLINLADFKERERVLQHEASQDYLTGLLNRRGFCTAVDSLRKEDLPLAVYLFDLDHMKEVNDKYGHDAGDEMLCHFADLLRSHTRSGDILCRYGGDEFAVILRNIYSAESIQKKGETICQHFHNYLLPDGTSAACSGGAVLCDKDEMLSEKLIERADQALYQAKEGKKGGFCLWEEKENANTKETSGKK